MIQQKVATQYFKNLLDWSRIAKPDYSNFKPEKINLKNLVDENILNLGAIFSQ